MEEKNNISDQLKVTPPSKRLNWLKSQPGDIQNKIVSWVGAKKLVRLLKNEKPAAIAAYFAGLSSDDLADCLGEMQPKRRSAVMAALPQKVREQAERLLKYGKETAGGLMAEEFISFPPSTKLGEVIEELRKNVLAPEKVFYIYVLDDAKRLNGVLTMRDLVLKEPDLQVRDVMRDDIISVKPEIDQEELTRIFQQMRLLALPVVDTKGRMLGVVTFDDIAPVIEQERSEDMLKLSGVSDPLKGMLEPLPDQLRRRLPWLVLNLFLSIGAVSVVAAFEGTIQAIVALSVLLPIVSNMGGNSGIQTLSMMIRALAMGEIKLRQAWPVFRQESLVGLINGITLGTLLGIAAYIWKGIPALGLVAGLAIWINTYIAGIVGALLPLGLQRFRLDPASSAGPILTTVTDLVGFFVTLKIADFLLPYLVKSVS